MCAFADSRRSQKDQAQPMNNSGLRCAHVGGPLEPGGAIGTVRRVHEFTLRCRECFDKTKRFLQPVREPSVRGRHQGMPWVTDSCEILANAQSAAHPTKNDRNPSLWFRYRSHHKNPERKKAKYCFTALRVAGAAGNSTLNDDARLRSSGSRNRARLRTARAQTES